MPSKSSCARCGRRIEEGLENRINGKIYGPECAEKVVSAMDVPSLQEELFSFCKECGSIEQSSHKFWCSESSDA